MTDTQQRAVAAGFMHVLQTHADVYAQWEKIPKDDYAAIGKLIQDTMGLAQTPSQADIHAMASYVDAHLKEDVATVQAANANAPRHVGFIAMMQQS